MQTESQYRYKGVPVVVLDSIGGLRQIAESEHGVPFWVKAEKLKPVKQRKTRYHDAPAIAADPFVAWLLTQRVTIYGDCPPEVLERFCARYLDATGECFDRECKHFSVHDADKSWSYSLYVYFPKPPEGLVAPHPATNRPRSTRLVIANNEFVFGLLALGLRFGSNQPLQTPK